MASYDMRFAGVPFVPDTARIVRMDMKTPYGEVEKQLAPRTQQSEADLNRLMKSVRNK